jgi:hypothetical protein
MEAKENSNIIGNLYSFRGSPVIVISEFKRLVIEKNIVNNQKRYFVLFPSGGIDVVLKDNLKKIST